MRPHTPIIALLLAVLPLACSGDNLSPGNPERYSLRVWNKTGRDIEDLRTHADLSYLEATPLLTENLVDEATFVIPEFLPGDHVTVMRRNVDGGKLIAFTTETGLDPVKDGYTLLVFQESFRLVPPDDTEGGPGADGANPGGDADTAGDP